MTNLVSTRRSAWFSSSIPKSKVQSWVSEVGCHVEPDPFQADLLFGDNPESPDLERIFKSKEYLAGHLTVFHSDYIVPAARQEVVTNMNLLKFLLLPRRELGEHGISIVQCLKSRVNETNRKLLVSETRKVCRKTQDNSENQEVSEKFVTKDKVSRDCRTRERMSPLRSTVDESNQHGVSEFSSTPCMRSEVEISVKEDDSGEIPGNGASHHRFNLGVTHLHDIVIPRVKLMDFKLGVHGCHAIKIKTT